MGLKFNHIESKQSPLASFQNSTSSLPYSRADIHDRRDQSFFDNLITWLKSNWKLFLIGISVALCAILCLMVAGKIMKEYFEQILKSLEEVTFSKWLMLTGLGTGMVMIGAPILYLELGLGIAIRPVLLAISIAGCAKLFGICASYYISDRFFKKKIQLKFRANKFMRVLRSMSDENPGKALSLLSIIQMPMLLKNYSLPIFELTIKDILMYFYSLQLLQSVLFCIVGSTLDYTRQTSIWMDIIGYIAYAATIAVFYIVYKQTKKLLQLDEQQQLNGSNQEGGIELTFKISYQHTQKLESPEIVTLVTPHLRNVEEKDNKATEQQQGHLEMAIL